MARVLVLFLLVEALVFVAEASHVASNNVNHGTAEAPLYKLRRMGKHQHNRPSVAPCLSPSIMPLGTDNKNYSEGLSFLNQENAPTQMQGMEIKKQHHHSFDKSVAGGGFIVGGLATTFLVAIGCYIRATRRKNAEPTSPSSAASLSNKV